MTISFLVFIVSWPVSLAMMDFRDWGGTFVPEDHATLNLGTHPPFAPPVKNPALPVIPVPDFAYFATPPYPPSSFIYATNEHRPPYDISKPSMEPFPGCDASYALLCSVQHSIRLVTKARLAVCPHLTGGQRQAALQTITEGTFAAEGATGFGVFAFMPNGSIIADGLKPYLVGQRVDGYLATGVVAQPTLLQYIKWVTSFGGGFVPHYSTRITSATSAQMQAIFSAPDAIQASMYVEPCPNGEVIGVAFGRAPFPIEQGCTATHNGFCAIASVRRAVGLNLVDWLNAHVWEEIVPQNSEIGTERSITGELGRYTPGSVTFYSFRYLLGWYCWLCNPGPNPWWNPGPFKLNGNTALATGGGLAKKVNGRNLTWVGGYTPVDVPGLSKGDWIMSVLNKACLQGGAWRNYWWDAAGIGYHFKVSLVVGATWNNTPIFLGMGTTHRAGIKWKGPVCEDCSSAASWPCCPANCEVLAAHAQAQVLTIDGSWDDLSDNKWFGASHATSRWFEAEVNAKTGDWPSGFYVSAFDYNGTCVADGSTRSRIGMTWTAILGASAQSIHEKFKYVADHGGGWVPYIWSDGGRKLAYATKQQKYGRFYYITVAFSQNHAQMIEKCTAQYAEPCSEHNAQAVIGMANADILSTANEAGFTQAILNIMERKGSYASSSTQDFAIHVYDADWGCVKASTGITIGPRRACPPLAPAAKEALEATAFGTWATVTSEEVFFYVLRVNFKPPGESFKRDIRLTVRVTSASAPGRCGAEVQEECPANSHCSLAGRCACDSGFLASFTPNTSHCGKFKPASMKCVDVRGVDTTSNTIATVLTMKGLDSAKLDTKATAKKQLEEDIKEAFLDNLSGYTSKDVVVVFSQGSAAAIVRILPKMGQGRQLENAVKENMASVQLAVQMKVAAMVTADASLLETGATASDLVLSHDDPVEEASRKCAAGYFCPDGTPFPCPEGQFCPVGASQPVLCPAGTKGNQTKASSNTSCFECAPGTMTDLPGQTACTSCAAGTFEADVGKSQCRRCPVSWYSNSTRATSCERCEGILPGSFTRFMAAASPDDCVCPSGTYEGSAGACVVCGVGLLCDMSGLTEPKQARGFFVKKLTNIQLVTKTYSVYRCTDPKECPSGVVETCATGRTGIACGNCVANTYVADNGECLPCGDADVVPFVVTAVLAFLMFIPLFKFSTSDISRQHLTTVTAAIALGQVAVSVQMLAVFKQVDISWKNPVDTILRLVDFLTFNLDLLRIQCIFPKDDPVMNFAFTLILFPVFMVVLAAVGHSGKLCGKTGFSFDRYFNSVGLVATMIYISITTLVSKPLHCLENPNGSSSMASNAAVVCWDSSQHQWLVGLGVLSILMYPVSILAVIVQITYRYPALVKSGSLRTIELYRFLFSRFEPSCYFWGLGNMVRNLLMALAPVVFANSPIAQVIMIECVILVSLIGTSRLRPWRTAIANNMDVGIGFAMTIFILVAGLLMEVDVNEGAVVLSVIAAGLVLVVFMTLIGVLVLSVYQRLAPDMFGALLCHHKAGAGSLARFFKIKIDKYSTSKIFIDSDNLVNLDLLFDIVRTQIRNLVIIATRMTLTRPWCAGEITTAVVNSIPIQQAICNDYVPPDPKFLEDLAGLWSEEQQCLLGQYGIKIEMIQSAYAHLLTLATIPLKRCRDFAQQEGVIAEVASACGLRNTRSTNDASTKATHNCRIIVAGASLDAESCCTCEVMAIMLQTMTHVAANAVHCVEDAEAHLATAEYIVTMLSKGLLQDQQFVSVLTMVEAKRRIDPMEIVTVLADSDFGFPDPAFYERLEKDGALEVAACFKRMLRVLAVPFSPNGSWAIMSTQVGEISRRMRRCEDPIQEYKVEKLDPDQVQMYQAAVQTAVQGTVQTTPLVKATVQTYQEAEALLSETLVQTRNQLGQHPKTLELMNKLTEALGGMPDTQMKYADV